MTAPSVEAVDQAAVEIVDDSGDELRMRFPVLVIEGMPTSDGRLIEAGALTPRALPLSLLAQAESSHGGDDPGPAVVIGRLDSMERTPGPEVVSRRTGEPFPEGTFVWSATGVIDARHPIAELVRKGYLRGVSVDLAGMDYEIVGEDGEAMADWEGRSKLITHAAELAAATLVPVPAFGDAYGELADEETIPEPVKPEDLPDGLLASAVPAWRSPEVGDPVHTITAAADEGMPVRIPPDSVEQLTAVIDTGADRDAAELATAIVEHIAQQWALDEPVTEDELPAEDGIVAAAAEVEGGFPEDEQPCQYGPEPAIESLVFRDGDAYVPVCAEHRQQAEDELAAAGEEIAEIVPIGSAPAEQTPVDAVTAAADEPHTGGMIALVPADPAALVVDGGEPADELHLTLAYLGDDVTDWDDDQRAAVLSGVEQLAAVTPPVEGEVMGHAAFNPTGAHDHEPCAVYLVTADMLPALKSEAAAFDVSEHPVFLPHVTAGYGLAPDALSFVGPVVFDRLRVALGEEVQDFPLGEPATEVDDDPEGEPAEIVASVAAAPASVDPVRQPPAQEPAMTAAAITRPPADWFTNPELDGPTAMRVTEDGRVYGHLAAWDVPHIGMPGQRVTAPRSSSGYAYFAVGAVLCDDGLEVPVGHITLDTGHAPTTLGQQAAAAHYDHTGTVVADVAAGEDQFGIWVAGALRPGVDEVTAAKLRASALSGDWRRVGSSLELVAALAVNTPGFPIPRARVASGQPLALVAAGVLRPEPVAPGSAGAVVLDYDTLADALATRLDARREAGELSARHAALVAELDDTPAVVAALLAEVDDSPQRAAELFAELDGEGDFLSGMPPQLKAEWLGGAIAARIAYGTPGQFDRCTAIAREKGVPGAQIDGMCADLIREATGKNPGDHD